MATTTEQRLKDFVKLLRGDHSLTPWREFERWCELAYCALSKPCAESAAAMDATEQRFEQILRGHDARRSAYEEMLGLAAMELRDTGADFLGRVAGHDEVRALSDGAGQFFTPFEVSRMMAGMTMSDAPELMERRGFLTIAEPASGAGGMLLATAAVLRAQGIDVTNDIWFEAVDISALCFHMTYVQMALAGLSGIVWHGDTLANQFHAKRRTPTAVLFWLKHGDPHGEPAAVTVERTADAPDGQLRLAL